MNGRMVLSALRNVLAEETPPVLLLTGAGDEESRAAEIGASLGMSKPFRVGELISAVDDFLAASRREAS